MRHPSSLADVDQSAHGDYITLVNFLRSIFLGLVLSASAFAQGPAVKPSVPQPTPKQPPAMPTPAPTPQEEMIRMQFPNANVKEVLSLYERLTNSKLVYDNTVQGPVNIVLSSPVTKEMAIKIIEINLLLNGFTLVPDSPGIIKVIGLSKNPRAAGIPIYSDFDLIPEGNQVITFVFKLQYADPTELQQTLAQYIAPSLYTSVVALPKSQALIVTENTSVLRGLFKILKEIDVPPAEVVSEFIELKRADAKDVLEKLEKIFEKPQTPGGAVAAARAPRPVTPDGQPAVAAEQNLSITIQGGTGLSEDSIIAGKIKLTADVRTNRIHVITRPINVPFIRRLIQEFDSNIPFGQPAKRALKFISASDVLEVVVQAISEPGVKAEQGAGGTTGGSKTNIPTNTNSGSSFGGGMGGSGGSGLNVSEELSTQQVDTTPKAVTVGNTKIIADPRENTIIVLGNTEVQQKIFKLLDQMDVRAPQVTLSTVIGELSLADNKRFGVDYLQRPGNVATSGTVGSVGLLALARRFALTSFTGSPIAGSAASALGAATGGVTAVLSPTDSLDVIVSALDSTGRFRVTQRPMVFASNNKKAIIASGEEIAVPTQTLSNVANGNVLNNNTAAVSSSVTYKPVELKLEVVPLINSEREVNLDIVQTLNSDSGKSTNVGGSSIPTITTRYIKTSVSVPNRGTVVLGGLIKRNIRDDTSGIPVISRIPVIGYLFKNTSKQSDREELIILIRPVVTTSPFETVENSQTEQQRLIIEPDVESTITGKKPKVAPTPKPVPFRYKQ